MRSILLATLIVVAGLAQVSAQGLPTFPTATYPADGTFCGFMTLCEGKATVKK